MRARFLAFWSSFVAVFQKEFVHIRRDRATLVIALTIPIFQLTLFGAKRGYLANTRSLCQHAPSSKVEYTGQNGKTLTQKVPIKIACAGKPKRPTRHRH